MHLRQTDSATTFALWFIHFSNPMHSFDGLRLHPISRNILPCPVFKEVARKTGK